MKILSVESSSDINSVCISEDDVVISNIEALRPRDYSVSLMSLIKNTLNQVKLGLNDIDGVAVGIGPGSFTGLRIGVTAVKGFNLALNKKIVGVCSLDAVALNGAYFNGDICVIIDAKKNQIYSCIYKSKDGSIKRRSKYLLTTIDRLMGKIKTRTLFLGDAINLHKGLLEKNKNKYILGQKSDWYPKASGIAKLAQGRFNKGDFDDADSLTPMYLYSQYCTIMKKSKKR